MAVKKRKKPYTQIGLRRMTCEVRGCTAKAKYQWNICADSNVFRRLCREHDVELNEIVMRWAFGDTREADLEAYRKRA